MVACRDICTFGSEKCYLRRRIRPKVLARRSKKCYFGEGNCHFRAQKSAISGETFAGASRGLWLTNDRNCTAGKTLNVLRLLFLSQNGTSSGTLEPSQNRCQHSHLPLSSTSVPIRSVGWNSKINALELLNEIWVRNGFSRNKRNRNSGLCWE